MRKAVVLVAVTAALGVLAASASGAGGSRSISIVKTSVGANGAVTVTVTITGWQMLPKLVGKRRNSTVGGHWHILVDGKYNTFSSSATTGTSLPLAKGAHVIVAELANNDHSGLAPPVLSKPAKVAVSAGSTGSTGSTGGGTSSSGGGGSTSSGGDYAGTY